MVPWISRDIAGLTVGGAIVVAGIVIAELEFLPLRDPIRPEELVENLRVDVHHCLFSRNFRCDLMTSFHALTQAPRVPDAAVGARFTTKGTSIHSYGEGGKAVAIEWPPA